MFCIVSQVKKKKKRKETNQKNKKEFKGKKPNNPSMRCQDGTISGHRLSNAPKQMDFYQASNIPELLLQQSTLRILLMKGTRASSLLVI